MLLNHVLYDPDIFKYQCLFYLLLFIMVLICWAKCLFSLGQAEMVFSFYAHKNDTVQVLSHIFIVWLIKHIRL